MKVKILLIEFILLTIFITKSYSQDYHVRIAFIGNSITFGANLSNPAEESYPGQLTDMLTEIYGDTCTVRNYAISSRTMLKKGDFPFWDDDSFTYCLQSAPDILFISLGTNDSKPYNWAYGDEFYSDYKSMIDTFKLRSPRTQFFVCLPPPAFQVVFDISETVIVNEIIPLIDSVAQETGAYVVDFHTPLLDSVALFPDYIHPNVQGSKAMADIVLERIIETDVIHAIEPGYTYVTRLKTDKEHCIENDSVTLSWTSLNADSVFFDGVQVTSNGSLKVSAVVPTFYSVLAYGEKNNDSVSIMQDFYHPVISRLILIPSRADIFEGDTLPFTLSYKDQYTRTMQNDSTEVNWSVANGFGSLINEDYSSASYIAESAGIDTVIVQIRDFSDKTTVEITPLTADENFSHESINIFPNPASDQLYITGSDFDQMELLDLKGRVVFSTNIPVQHINTEKFENGIYVIKLYTDENKIAQKIIISHK